MLEHYINNPEEAIRELQVLCGTCNMIKRFDNNEFSLPRYKSGIMKSMKYYRSLGWVKKEGG